MSRVSIILTNRETRQTACGWVNKAPVNTVFSLKETKRSVPQNDKMHAALTDVARQVVWSGTKLAKDDWKLVLLDGYWRSKGESLRLVPNVDGTGFVPLSARSSSDLTKEEMSEFIEYVHWFGAQHDVTFTDPETTTAARAAGGGETNPSAGAAS